jgi:hypothetical protein
MRDELLLDDPLVDKVWEQLKSLHTELPPGLRLKTEIVRKPNGMVAIDVEGIDGTPHDREHKVVFYTGLRGKYEDILAGDHHFVNLATAVRLELTFWQLCNKDTSLFRGVPGWR